SSPAKCGALESWVIQPPTRTCCCCSPRWRLCWDGRAMARRKGPVSRPPTPCTLRPKRRPPGCRVSQWPSSDFERGLSRVASGASQFLLYLQQAVVFCDAFAASGRAGLNLAGAQSYDQVSDEGIGGLTRTMRYHGGPA